jgi:translation elongation factor EF-Ts
MAQGAVCAYVHTGNRIGVLVEVHCQSEATTRTEAFQRLVRELAIQIATTPQAEFVSLEDDPRPTGGVPAVPKGPLPGGLAAEALPPT